jgi:hypothetical protein
MNQVLQRFLPGAAEFSNFVAGKSGEQQMKGKHLNVMKIKQSSINYIAAGLVAAAMISVITPVLATDQVPFRGVVSGSVTSITPLDDCHQRAEAVNSGNATQLGRFSGSAEFVLDVCNLTYIGNYAWTAANGDSISGPFSGSLTPTSVSGVFDNTETAFITSGTGRFANATGTFNLGGQIDLNAGTFYLPWQDGTISTVGSGH